MNKIGPDPRVTSGPGFFQSVVEWMRRAAQVVNALVDFSAAPTAPTQVNTDNSTKVATTAWVRNAMANIASAAGFAGSLSPNGYLKLPSWLGGWIVQWTKVLNANNVGGATTSVSFPLTFPTACVFAATLGCETAAGKSFTANFACAVNTVTAAGLSFVTYTSSGGFETTSNNTYVNILAVGY